jgi:ribose-phosphate pyrophosphokinase
LATAGAGRVLTMALHAPQVHGFFSMPVDHLHAQHELAEYFRARGDLANTVVVAPDMGYAKQAAAFARRLDLPVALGAKQRISDTKVVISAVIGETAGKDVIVIDDEIAAGSTVIEVLGHLRMRGVGKVRVACTHGLFGRGSLERLASEPEVTEIVTMNTAPISSEKRIAKLTVLSVGPALAEAIRRIHEGESVSELFE